MDVLPHTFSLNDAYPQTQPETGDGVCPEAPGELEWGGQCSS